jgi:para-nitrobenzyl esterase
MKVFFLIILSLFFINFISASGVISTTSGDVTGTLKRGVILYEDIPYAEAPVGNLRWKAPRRIENKVEIYPKENNFCIQRPSNLGGVEGKDFFVGSEDCLYLDIFTPKKTNNKKLPVMFWIHGGGNTSGLKDLYDFSKVVSKHDVIIVRINYRLGPFGWFTHPAIQRFQNGEDKTSNFGTLDIVMALKWVKDNISKFGGAPDNVTIFGESAGGHNVFSLLVSSKAKGLFHKAISMSGYTTSISLEDAYKPKKTSSTSNYSSFSVVDKLNKKFNTSVDSVEDILQRERKMLLSISARDFFEIYSQRDTYDEIPLLTNDAIVIPKIGLKEALSNKEHLNIVPTIVGSNRDEVKLWLATARYFVDLDYSIIGSILQIPRVVLVNKESFEAFNFYRSTAWKIRGVDNPLLSMSTAGNENLYSYRYDWDDHRRLVVANFQSLIGAAHATEIPILTGNYDLVGGYPLSDLIYPPSFSKRYTSKNMMRFWTNFAKFGVPGSSTNSVEWKNYSSNDGSKNYLIIDKRKNLKMISESFTLDSLSDQLFSDQRLSQLEKCVVLLQMYTYVGNDLYDNAQSSMLQTCNRVESENFIKENASFIEF